METLGLVDFNIGELLDKDKIMSENYCSEKVYQSLFLS